MISIFISYVDLGINQLGAVYEGLMSYTGFFAADDLSKPSKRQLDLLVELTRRAEVLWGLALRRLQIAEAESRRGIPVWGHEAERHGSKVAREQIEASLADPDGAYRRLRLIMDAWCAVWS